MQYVLSDQPLNSEQASTSGENDSQISSDSVTSSGTDHEIKEPSTCMPAASEPRALSNKAPYMLQ